MNFPPPPESSVRPVELTPPSAPSRTPVWWPLVAAAVILAGLVLLGFAALLVSRAVIDSNCWVGINGSAVRIEVQGPNAAQICRQAISHGDYAASGPQPGEYLVCHYQVEGTHVEVWDLDAALIGQTVCAQLRQQPGVSSS